MKGKLLVMGLLATLPLFGAFTTSSESNTPSIVRVERGKYNSEARLKIMSPPVLKKDSPILVLVSNFPIGVDVKSQQLNDEGVKENPYGSRVLLMFSNGRRLYVTKDDVNLLFAQRSYFNKRFRVKVPENIYKDVEQSSFAIYSMLVNSYGETIKNENAFFTDVYCYSKEKSDVKQMKENLKKPFLVYNEPFGVIEGGNVLLDFYLRNVELSKTGYTVDLIVDDHKITKITKWTPNVIKNLKKGVHTIKLELIDPSGKVLNNPASVNSATIHIK